MDRVTREDMIAAELTIAANYRREAKRRRRKNAALADRLDRWADASLSRAEQMRCGPLFRGKE